MANITLSQKQKGFIVFQLWFTIIVIEIIIAIILSVPFYKFISG